MLERITNTWRRAQKHYTAPFDPEFIEASNKVLLQVAKFGLNYPRIAAQLGVTAAKVETMVILIEMASPHLLNSVLLPRKRMIRKTGKRFRPNGDGIFPLEYYLLKCQPLSPPSPPA